MKNTKEQFKEWATDCMGWSESDVQESIDDGIYQIVDVAPDVNLSELNNYLNN